MGPQQELYPGWLALPEQLRRELWDPSVHEVAGDILDVSKEGTDRRETGVAGVEAISFASFTKSSGAERSESNRWERSWR